MSVIRNAYEVAQTFRYAGPTPPNRPSRDPLVGLNAQARYNHAMTPLERELGEKLLSRYEDWKLIGYTAIYFKRMLTPGDPIYKGPVRTVKHLLGKNLSDKSGFVRLKKARRLDLSVEALICQDMWRPLFEDWEVARATERLKSNSDTADSLTLVN